MKYLILVFLLVGCGSKDGPNGTLIYFDESGCHSSLLVKYDNGTCSVYDDVSVVYTDIDIDVHYRDGWIEIINSDYGTVGVR